MIPRFLDSIWHVRGTVALPPTQTADDAFDRLDALFRQPGTRHERSGDTLTFHKKDQAAQDRMAVFDDGLLRIDRDPAGPVLRYRLTSRALLFCFLAPLLFLAFAQVTIFLGTLDTPTAKTKKDDKPKPVRVLNPIDKALGAPAPDPPKKKGAKGDDDKKPSPTPAYVFAGIFAALYAIGRVLEGRRVKTLFRTGLMQA